VTADAWQSLRRHTAARIALGRAGGSLPTGAVLDFAMAHAAARDAVHAELDVMKLSRDVNDLLLPLHLQSAARDRAAYLHRPDLGRRLDPDSRRLLEGVHGAFDVSLVVGDGLSAIAVQHHVPPLLKLLVPKLKQAGFRLAPLAVARHARVAIQDEIGELLNAVASVILIGERPGLSSPDSLGAYLVFGPKSGNTDARRNCVSNIRPGGLRIEAAAETIFYLLSESIRRKLSGIKLKDERGTTLMP
jgi:ethanolamine ammonia-lyase small subunit